MIPGVGSSDMNSPFPRPPSRPARPGANLQGPNTQGRGQPPPNRLVLPPPSAFNRAQPGQIPGVGNQNFMQNMQRPPFNQRLLLFYPISLSILFFSFLLSPFSFKFYGFIILFDLFFPFCFSFFFFFFFFFFVVQ